MSTRRPHDPEDECQDESPCVDDYGRHGTPLDDLRWDW